MRILVLHTICYDDPRKTIDDHVYSFTRYNKNKDIEFFYCDVILNLPIFLSWFNWDGIIIHYSLLGLRLKTLEWKIISQQLKKIHSINACKVMIPQDEYNNTEELWKVINECGIETVFTCAYSKDFNTLYPIEKTSLKYRFTTLTGFVDEETMKNINHLSIGIERSIDIGYRARKLPYWVGKHGQLKYELAEAVLNSSYPHNLKLDISTQSRDTFHGDEWMHFLLRSRTMLGCLGGSSMIDVTGEIRLKVDAYVKEHPNASFEEVEMACFPELDNTISVFALSPRHFECAMTKTCQILVEGDYLGIFKPGVHYIELKKDFSNLPEVFEKVADKVYCQQIAENAYRDIICSGKYTYREFAKTVIEHICTQAIPKKKHSKIGSNLLNFFFRRRVKMLRIRVFLSNILIRVCLKFNKIKNIDRKVVDGQA